MTSELARIPTGPDPEVEVDPWLRRPAETTKAYGAFRTYLELGPGRDLKSVMRVYDASPASVRKWSKENQWDLRAAAYDAEQDLALRRANFTAYQDMAVRHAAAASEQIDALMIPARHLLKRFHDDPAKVAAELDALHLTALVDMITDLSKHLPALLAAERQARGGASDITEHRSQVTIDHQVTHDHTSAERTAELLAILGDAGLVQPRPVAEDETPLIVDTEAHEVDPAHTDPAASSLPRPPT